MIKEELFGTLADQTKLHLIKIYNKKGEHIELIDYGASLHSVYVLEQNQIPSDVILGVREPQELTKFSTEGSIIGRVANRIKDGRFTLNGKFTQLEASNFGNYLHGESGSYAHRIFSYKIINEESVAFHYLDHGEGDFNNQVDVTVTYGFNDQSELSISYELIALDEDTIVSPTSHAYFNLGNYGSILDHQLKINSDRLAVKDATGCPNGKTLEVQNTCFDFRNFKTIGSGLKQIQTSNPEYDDYFVLNDHDLLKPIATLYDPTSKRTLEVFTDQPCLVIYTPHFTDLFNHKHGSGKYPKYAGISLETQFVPDAINHESFQKPIVRKGESFRSTTTYKFSVLS